jgi:hypothetical protein
MWNVDAKKDASRESGNKIPDCADIVGQFSMIRFMPKL